MKILNVTERAGGLTPNRAKELSYRIFGEIAENYEGDWGDVPLAYTKAAQASGQGFDAQLSRQIQKSAENQDVEITAVLTEIRAVLTKEAP
jgi:hypothetical protein